MSNEAVVKDRALDVAGLPTVVFGHRSLMWWGTLGVMAIEGTVFALAVMAYFYLRTQKYAPAAIDRFRAILKSDPEYSRRDAVYFYLAEALLKMNQSAEAVPLLDRLIMEFESSEYLEQTRKLLETLRADVKKTGSVSHES